MSNVEKMFVENQLEILKTIIRDNRVLTLTNERIKRHLDVLNNIHHVITVMEDIDEKN